jgi:hypothetical protein
MAQPLGILRWDAREQLGCEVRNRRLRGEEICEHRAGQNVTRQRQHVKKLFR